MGCKPGTTNNPNGRPKGARDVLPHGVSKLIKAARQAEELGIKTDEAWGVVLGIMRGQLRGRWLGDRLRAAVFVLEQEIGKATQRIELTDKRETLVGRLRSARERAGLHSVDGRAAS